jgi:hypothetical protein
MYIFYLFIYNMQPDTLDLKSHSLPEPAVANWQQSPQHKRKRYIHTYIYIVQTTKIHDSRLMHYNF